MRDFAPLNLCAVRGVAVRKYPLTWRYGAETRSGSADFLLFGDVRVVRVDEAQPAGDTREPKFLS